MHSACGSAGLRTADGGYELPADLFRVSVVRLWENRYPVNVRTGADAVSARVAHSFFLEADEAGAVLSSAPAITRAC